MHDMPQDLAEEMDKDSYSSKTGLRPQDLTSHTPGEGVESAVEGNPDATMTQARSAEVTERIGRERLASDGVGGQG